jgi:hypothetical protein
MSLEANVCEKSLGPVMRITRILAVDCDGYHDPVDDYGIRAYQFIHIHP